MNIGYWVTRALLCKKFLFEATTRTNRPQASVKVSLSLIGTREIKGRGGVIQQMRKVSII